MNQNPPIEPNPGSQNSSAGIGRPLRVLAWRAWAPGLPDREAFHTWLLGHGAYEPVEAKPPCAAVPSRLRRRCTYLTRMVLETALPVCDDAGLATDAVNLVYGSRNGEIVILRDLLSDIFDREPLSPTAFSNSVHHTPTGYFGLVTKNKGISRTVSAHRDTFTCAYLEAVMLATRYPETPVLLVIADEQTPEPFDRILHPPPFPHSVAMILAPAPAGSGIGLTRVRNAAPSPEGAGREPAAEEGEEQVFSFLRWYLGDEAQLDLDTEFGGVRWWR
ncbi:beta-ketoacyl synthase chain length factor [Sulfidibacter corallicola]|uniref:Beta-ketoacyl synthase chain length factor n=1 Tax=Sulfidibacter corallicola TaxID=2818388 RepID=A0A8A4TI00_SULCO|nr:beta-ketoacyl synthase chain length factor [Sulfidibacter corallicola]QTD49546.1 beta-ketoacyl synthase chain length factor [Sulfidibacter corallicola]